MVSLPWLLRAGRYSAMVSYFSLEYLLFFLPIIVLLYSLTKEKYKKYFLLIASYAFFWMISGTLIVYLLASTLLIHYFGIWLERIGLQEKEHLGQVDKSERKEIKNAYLKQKRVVMGLAVLIHVGILAVLKYSGFFTENINDLLNAIGFSVQLLIPRYAMPIGISFFTMQALSYTFDVYRGTIRAEENILKLALFMSFFPQIVEGPICRYEQTAEQLWNVSGIKHENLVFGCQRILFGMMKKIVVADRLNPFIGEIFTNHRNYDGGITALAAVAYTIQLYMEFSGTMDAVIGTAQIFGIILPENFSRPFFSRTISDFWARWHITLGAWFKDYIFYPVTLSKPIKKVTSKIKKVAGNYIALLFSCGIALFCVWACNGLWHGAAWNYIFFGMYHFALIMMGNMVEPFTKKMKKFFHIPASAIWWQVFQIIRTSILVVIGELFFRAHGLASGLMMFRKMLTEFSVASINWQKISDLGLDKQDVGIVAVTLLIVLIVSILNERGVKIRENFSRCHVALRWIGIYAFVLYIVVFGAYGLGYIPVDPIYANF